MTPFWLNFFHAVTTTDDGWAGPELPMCGWILMYCFLFVCFWSFICFKLLFLCLENWKRKRVWRLDFQGNDHPAKMSFINIRASIEPAGGAWITPLWLNCNQHTAPTQLNVHLFPANSWLILPKVRGDAGVYQQSLVKWQESSPDRSSGHQRAQASLTFASSRHNINVSDCRRNPKTHACTQKTCKLQTPSQSPLL